MRTNFEEPSVIDDIPREECGVFGVWAPGEEVAKIAYYGIFALQHRGQEAAGIAVGDGHRVVVMKDLGLVAQVFDESKLRSLRGHVAIGHTRYSTTGSTTWANAQPTLRHTSSGRDLALAHNGNLVNTAQLAAMLSPRSKLGANGTRRADPIASTDTDILLGLLASEPGELDPAEAAARVLPRLEGAYSLVFCDEYFLYAARDPHGVRPLVVGRLDTGWVVASETCALDIVGAEVVREVEPGELVIIDANGPRFSRFAAATRHHCLFEYVYLARPDSVFVGRSVHATRVELGRLLAREHPAPGADLVIPVPESGTPAAVGFSQQAGIPYGQGLVKNTYVGRTFIQPSQTIRQRGIRLKLNPLREEIAGRSLVVVDDSIVRGNTQRALVRMLRDAGAREVHVRISSPPVRWPCFYGIDFASRAELAAATQSVEQIRDSIGADSLGYVSLDALVAASRQPANDLCRACFDGDYPIAIPERVGKYVLEIEPVPAGTSR